MNNKKGFTLTEVLLAAMVVGLLGVALAALTSSATKEGGRGRTRIILRNNLSMALRQLRQDIHGASSISFPSGKLLEINQAYKAGPDSAQNTIVYELSTAGASAPAHIQPAGSTVGNVITRQVNGGTAQPWLSNVKKISDEYPHFYLENAADSATSVGINSVLRVDIIVEVPSNPVVNEVVHETFMLPHGIDVKHPTGGI